MLNLIIPQGPSHRSNLPPFEGRTAEERMEEAKQESAERLTCLRLESLVPLYHAWIEAEYSGSQHRATLAWRAYCDARRGTGFVPGLPVVWPDGIDGRLPEVTQ